jgi:ubiquinone/menaquinone biosynthesis C-methylase UbiE
MRSVGFRMKSSSKNIGYVSAQYLKRIARTQGKKVKQTSLKLMDIQEDSQVLDVGCGPATDTLLFAKFIGPNGRVVGIDCDPMMVEEANTELAKHKTEKNVKHIVGDVHSLPFSNGEFDRVHAERLFQVLPKTDAPKVFSELNRVLKPGGILVLVDTDWASASVNYSNLELERRLIQFFGTRMRPNGFAARHLAEMLKQEAYVDITIEVMPVVIREFEQTPFGNWLIAEATKAGVATGQEMEHWRKELAEKTAQETFLSHTNIVLASGKKK